jgi:methylated-DNA-[protein]-cysteine S-methyltransferase
MNADRNKRIVLGAASAYSGAAMNQTTQHYLVFETAAGFCGIAWSDAGITRFMLPSSTADATEHNLRRRLTDARPGTPPPHVMAAVDAAKRYFDGEKIDFSDLQLDLGGQDEFFRKIYAAARRVSWGSTTTYGALAKQLGAGPEIARNVGQAMAKNPVPLIIPCHRVLAAGGKLGGFSAPGGSATKQRMLELEGVDLGPPPPEQQTLGL